MRFVCPYCGEITRHLIARQSFAHAKCKVCKRKFRIVPIAVREEDGDGKPAYDECINDHFKMAGLGVVIALVAVGVMVLIGGIVVKLGH